MRQSDGNTGGADSKNMRVLLNWLLTGCIVLGLLLCAACANGDVSQPQGNSEDKPADTAESSNTTLPVSPVEPPHPPAIPSTPEQENPDISQSAPDSNLPVSDTLGATTLITRQASTMTLTLQDMGQGWAQGSAIAPVIPQVTSSSHVYFTQGSAYAPGVQNTVAVYRSISMAEEAYAREKQTNLSTSNPGIGNECLLNNSVPINKLLVFRQNNVVVWLWLKQYKEGDIERYARIVEQRINTLTSPEQPSPAVATPSQQVPDETPAITQPGITKSMEGLVIKQAYQMVLTMEDMGSGWIKGNVSPPSYRGSTSSSTVCYSQGASFAPTVQNAIVVYRDKEAAANAYAGARPAGASLTNPAIGDECFLNNSVAIDRLLVFRKSNVVVWLWLKQYKTGDIEGYARTVEQKITF